VTPGVPIARFWLRLRRAWTWRLFVVTLALAAPIFLVAMQRLSDIEGQLHRRQAERGALRLIQTTIGALTATETLRAALLDPVAPRTRRVVVLQRANIDRALVALEAAGAEQFLIGPTRSNRQALRAAWARIADTGSGAQTQANATLAFTDELLKRLADLSDGSLLTYDPAIDVINLGDALTARLPDAIEPLDRAAQIALRRLRGGLRFADRIEMAKLSAASAASFAFYRDDLDLAGRANRRVAAILVRPEARAEATTRALVEQIDRATFAPSSGENAAVALRRARISAIEENEGLTRALVASTDEALGAQIALARRDLATTGFIALLALAFASGIVTIIARSMEARRELLLAEEQTRRLEAVFAQQSAERALLLTTWQFRAVFDGSPIGIAILDAEGSIVEANAALRGMLGTDSARVLVDFDPLQFGQMMGGRIPSYRLELRNEACGGEAWIELSVSLVRDGEGRPKSAIAMLQNISERKATQERLHYEATHDALTGLPQRALFMRSLDEAIRAARHDEHRLFAVMFVDLDHFKLVNDTFGHEAGDFVLRVTADRLRAGVRRSDVVARLHGDEFVILLTEVADMSTAIDVVVNRLCAAACQPVLIDGVPIPVSVSIGIAKDDGRYSDANAMLRDADVAMYRAKASGRARVTLFDPQMGAESEQRWQPSRMPLSDGIISEPR
jgi:diguanylate cyclase (GGDEF)-like protein